MVMSNTGFYWRDLEASVQRFGTEGYLLVFKLNTNK